MARKRPSGRKKCDRHGCSQPASAPPQTQRREYQCNQPEAPRLPRYCTDACRAIAVELEQARRVAQAVGPSAATTELWLAAVEVNDSLTRYRRLERELRAVANEVGVTDEHWQAIKRGQQHTNNTHQK